MSVEPAPTAGHEDLTARARAWAAEDPDEQTRSELQQAVADVEAGGDVTDLEDRFAGPLEFGTAGLRGALGAGSNRMNRVVVTRAAAGLAAYVNVSRAFVSTYGPLAGVFALLLWSLLSAISLFYGLAVCAQMEALRAGEPEPVYDDPGRPHSHEVGS